MDRRVPDNQRVFDLVGWEPTRNLEDILRAVIEYERAHPEED